MKGRHTAKDPGGMNTRGCGRAQRRIAPSHCDAFDVVVQQSTLPHTRARTPVAVNEAGNCRCHACLQNFTAIDRCALRLQKVR